MKFESHVTCDVADAIVVERVANQAGWKFSRIDGDALMGAKPHCYLTAYSPDAQTLKDDMDVVVELLKFNHVPVLRQKIERIIFDTKTGVDELAEFVGAGHTSGQDLS